MNIINVSKNIIATIKGTSNLPAIILGAHYDHLGHGESSTSLARADEISLVHPGADDNASGVAGLLSIAEYLIRLKSKGKLGGQHKIQRLSNSRSFLEELLSINLSSINKKPID